jgi:hypothetical protein
MATTYKVLGQSQPSAITATTAYTVPSSSSAVISTIAVCNLGAYPSTVRIAVRPDNESLANKHYIVYDATVAPQDTATFTLGITLGDTDVVTVYSLSGLVTFNLFGSEIN